MYIQRYMEHSFLFGAVFGTFYGLAKATPVRRFSLVPKYAIIFGATYSVYHGVAAYYRSEI